MSTDFADFEYDTEFLEPDAPEPNMVNPDLTEPDDKFVEEVKETARAKRYRLKTKHGLNFLMRILVQHPGTVPDAAAVIHHGPAVAKAVGHLADTDERARKIIDFITEDGIDNPYVLTMFTLLPMLFQVMRNHEQQLDNMSARGFRIRIPFTKRYIPVRFKFRIRVVGRNMTEAPDFLTAHVFGNPAVRDALDKQDIKVAWPDPRMNGRRAA